MQQEEIFFQLIRFALEKGRPVPECARQADWDALYDISMKQTLAGIVYHAIKQLPDDMQPKDDLAIKWLLRGEKIRHRNQLLNAECMRQCRELAQQGLRTCLLKGQGNALLYPTPYMRTPGDIDLWTDESREKVIRTIRRLHPATTLETMHIAYTVGKKIPVEVHFYPSYANYIVSDMRLKRYFREQASEQFANHVCLPEYSDPICVPTVAFNRIYQLSHIYRHLFYEGIGLRQVIDYYYLLRQGFTAEEKAAFEQTARHLKLYRFACGLMYILRDTLGLAEEYLIAPADEADGQFILSEIMTAGNMGHHDPRFGDTRNETTLHRFVRKRKRSLAFVGKYGMEAIAEPFSTTRQWIWAKRHADTPRTQTDDNKH